MDMGKSFRRKEDNQDMNGKFGRRSPEDEKWGEAIEERGTIDASIGSSKRALNGSQLGRTD